jgi:uncharacterized membrane protein
MSEDKTASIVLFVMGLFFVALGTALMIITETVTRYRSISYFQIPYQETIHPYSYEGAFMLIVGILALIVGVGMTMKKATARKVPETG